MSIKIKISKKPVDYDKAIRYLEKKVKSLHSQKTEELLWILSHPNIYTAGISTKINEILDKKINVIKTNRGGKITWHGPGQMIFYFVVSCLSLSQKLKTCHCSCFELSNLKLFPLVLNNFFLFEENCSNANSKNFFSGVSFTMSINL